MNLSMISSRSTALVLTVMAGAAMGAGDRLAAQGSAVVPARAGAQEGSDFDVLAGSCARRRQQILIGASWLVPLRGKDLRELWLRRDGSWPHALRATRAKLTLSVSVAARQPDRASSRFADNRGTSPVRVFSGAISLPSSPPISRAPAPWTPAHTVRITFQQPFRYTGGPLCLEIEGTRLGTGYCFWPIDADDFAAPGTVIQLSKACGRHAGAEGITLSAWAASLVVGGAAQLSTWGEPGAGAMLALSASTLRPPLALAAFGAPGCVLHVPLDVTLAEVLRPTPQGDGLTGWSLPLPVDPRLLNGRFHAQAVGLEASLPRSRWSNALGITTSNAVALTISSSLPTTGAAIVTSGAAAPNAPLPVTGHVAPGRLPVLRFVHR